MANGLTDIELVQRVKQGDQQSFAVLVDRYQNLAFTVAFKYVNNREDAEEISQSAFVKAYRSLPDYRGDAKFSTWLYTIVSSLSLTFLRRKKVDTFSLDSDRVFEVADNKEGSFKANQIETKSKVAMVQEAISRLSADDSQVLTLFYQAEQSLDEIGSIMGIDPNTAKVKLHRARQRLKTMLEKNYAHAVKDWQDL